MKRFFLLLLPVLLPALLLTCGRDKTADIPPQAGTPEFQIAEFAPTGEVPWENFEGGIWVLFDQPVVPLAQLKRPALESLSGAQLQGTNTFRFRTEALKLLSSVPSVAKAFISALPVPRNERFSLL